MSSNIFTVFKEFRFEAAHSLPHLPATHKCHRVHGHSYRVRVHATGPIDPVTHFVVDYADLSAAWKDAHDRLDHRFINEVPGLEISTSEYLAQWIFHLMKIRIPQISRVFVWETATAGACYPGET